MRLLLFTGFIVLSFMSTAQHIETSVGYGIGSYVSRTSGTQTDFSLAAPSFMASGLIRKPWVRSGGDKVKLEGAAGISFVHYSGEWMEFESNRLVEGNIIESFEGWRYTAASNVIGAEITPIIVTFLKYFELRTGFFLGMNITDTYREEYARTWTTDVNGIITIFDGAWTEVEPASFNPGFVAHWNSRAALNFKIKNVGFSPFFQFSRGLTNEGGSFYDQKIGTWRNHGGLSVRFELNN